jgi:hypothetical protein
MSKKALGGLILSVIVTTTFWILIMVYLGVTVDPASDLAEKVAALEQRGLLYYLNYSNAVLVTLLTVIMFAGFYVFLQKEHPIAALISIVFIPIYGIGNLISYLAQTLVIPQLIDLASLSETRPLALMFLRFTLQDWPGSAIAALNIFSYAILGIPSIIFATIMFRTYRRLRPGSVLLAASGFLSFLAMLGIAVNNPFLSRLTLLSGAIYLLALILLVVPFLRQESAKDNQC